MKEFPSHAIRERAKAFEKAGFPLIQAEIAGEQFEYFVIPQDLSPTLRNFAMRMTHTDFQHGTPGVVGVYGVSDAIPQRLRDYWAFHEFAEFNLLGIETEGRCQAAEKMVLSEVPSSLSREYVNLRLSFFEDLAAFFEEDLKSEVPNYTPADLEEINHSRSYLEFISGTVGYSDRRHPKVEL